MHCNVILGFADPAITYEQDNLQQLQSDIQVSEYTSHTANGQHNHHSKCIHELNRNVVTKLLRKLQLVANSAARNTCYYCTGKLAKESCS